jgi:hypothetical protein
MADNFPQIPRRLNLPRLPTKHEEILPWLKILVDAINQEMDKISNTVSGLEGATTLSDRPTAGIRGRTFYATDNGHFYVDDGTSWITLV